MNKQYTIQDYTITIPTTGGAGCIVHGKGGFRREFATEEEAVEFVDDMIYNDVFNEEGEA